jgi:hypothetical protein
MRTDTYRGYLVARTPVHHGGDEKAGTTSLVRRMTYVREGKRLNVPIVSGNSIRGYLRRLVMRDMLDTLDIKLTNLKVYHTLFAGGALTENDADGGRINLDTRKRLRTAIPPISIFGTAVGNQMPEGKLKCGMAIPVCRELVDLVPEIPSGVVPAIKSLEDLVSYHELVGHDFLTRHDDIHADRDEGERAQQMLAELEVVVAGTVFSQTLSLLDASDVERGVMGRAVELWRQRPYVGGKSGTGYGEVELHYNELPDSKPYMDWLTTNGNEVKGMIAELESTL